MDIHNATEIAYKNGYQKGKQDTAKEILNELNNLHKEGKGKIIQNGEHIYPEIVVVEKVYLDELAKQYGVDLGE